MIFLWNISHNDSVFWVQTAPENFLEGLSPQLHGKFPFFSFLVRCENMTYDLVYTCMLVTPTF